MTNLQHKGPPLAEAAGALIMVHGRGASPAHILSLYDHLALPNCAAVAPGAPGGTWYPHSFMVHTDKNQPHLDQALAQLDATYKTVLQAGLATHRIALLGFSQGACLVSEYALRHPRRYGALFILTGGYIGAPEQERHDTGAFDGAPVFIGVKDPDAHVPFERAEATAQRFAQLGAQVDFRRYPGEPHAINQDEINAVQTLMEGMLAS